GDLGRSAGIGYLGCGDEAILDHRISIYHPLDVGGDALAQLTRHGWRAEQPDQSIHGQCRIAGLCDRRDIGYGRGARGIGHRQNLDLASLDLRTRGGVGRFVDLHSTSGEIIHGLDRVAVRHLFDVNADALEPTLEDDVEGAGQAGPVELTGLAARQLDHVLERAWREVCRHRNSDDGIGYARNWGE